MQVARARSPARVRRTTRLLVVAITGLVAACGSAAGPAGQPSGPSAAPSTVVAASAPTAATPASSAAGASGAVGAAVAIDPELLSFVPAQVDGLVLAYDPETTARVTEDPALARDASGLAIGIAVDPATSDAAELTVVSVIRLRDPTVDEAWFRTYRDTYDKAACGSAGGVSGHAETTINARTVFVATCAGGAFVYHVRLAVGAIVVSALSVGSRRLGLKVMEGIKP
jgi:hypothetical protein